MAEETGIVRAEPMQVSESGALNPEAVLQQLETASQAMQKMRRIAVSLTTPKDWVKMGEVLYLQSTGAERILGALGLTSRIIDAPPDERMKDENGEYFIVRRRIGIFDRGGNMLAEHDGYCSSRDKFFGTVGGKLQPIEAVDVVNIRKKAYTNAFNQAVSRLVGLRGLTSQDLANFGRTAATTVEYKAPSKTGPSEQQKQAAAQAKKIDVTKIDQGLPIHAREIGTVDGPTLLTLWKNEAERVQAEYGLDAYEHYLKFSDGKCYSIGNPDLQGQKLSAKMRTWLEGTFKKMVVEFPEKGVGEQITDGGAEPDDDSVPSAGELFDRGGQGGTDAR